MLVELNDSPLDIITETIINGIVDNSKFFFRIITNKTLKKKTEIIKKMTKAISSQPLSSGLRKRHSFRVFGRNNKQFSMCCKCLSSEQSLGRKYDRNRIGV